MKGREGAGREGGSREGGMVGGCRVDREEQEEVERSGLEK